MSKLRYLCALCALTWAFTAPVAKAAGLDAKTCASLAGSKIAARDIALPTSGAVIASASFADQPDVGRYCKVLGAIKPVDPRAPDIDFRVNLPATWNEKALQLGGGGFNGKVPAGEQADFGDPGVPPPLEQGYVTLASDSGHEQEPGKDPATFALNPESFTNFLRDQLKKTHDVAVALMRKVYGKAPRRMYFQGGSQGGREALMVVKYWPQDYDGVLAVHPTNALTALHIDGILLGQTLYNTPGAWVPPAKTEMVSNKVYEACDALDGLKDGIIGNVKACDSTFKIASLRCPGGGDTGPDCLSDAQIGIFRTFAAPMKFPVTVSDGINSFPGWPVLEGGTIVGAFGTAPDRPAPGKMENGAFVYTMADQTMRYMLLHDPSFHTIDLDVAAHAAQLQALSRRLDMSSPDIDAFEKRGGKLFLLHGTSDMAVTPYNTINYYNSLKARYGAYLPKFVRFYMAAGFGHGNGNFVVGWDSLGALDRWVETGKAPGPQVATDTNKATAGRKRPLCEYPAYPKYKGNGDVDAAGSFICVPY